MVWRNEWADEWEQGYEPDGVLAWKERERARVKAAVKARRIGVRLNALQWLKAHPEAVHVDCARVCERLALEGLRLGPKAVLLLLRALGRDLPVGNAMPAIAKDDLALLGQWAAAALVPVKAGVVDLDDAEESLNACLRANEGGNITRRRLMRWLRHHGYGLRKSTQSNSGDVVACYYIVDVLLKRK